jgi:hypothetical protein
MRGERIGGSTDSLDKIRDILYLVESRQERGALSKALYCCQERKSDESDQII